MYRNITRIALCLVLFMSISSAETFNKGDQVIVKRGNIMCLSSKSANALSGLTRVETELKFMQMDIADSISDGEKPSYVKRLPAISKLDADFCQIDSYDLSYKFHRYAEDGKAILDSEKYWIAVYSDSLEKDKNNDKSENQGPTYNFAFSDEIESFPSDFVDKPIFLKCKRTDVKEEKNGSYNISPICEDSKGKYGFMTFNPFKIKVMTNSREMAREISKSGQSVKWFLGKLNKNTQKYALGEYTFLIEEVQYK